MRQMDPTSGRSPGLDFLRTFAFFVVALGHFGGMLAESFPAGGAARAWCEGFARFGGVGTNTFFLCSAFLLCRALNRGQRWADAVGRRMARLYPGFMAVLAAYLVVMLVLPEFSKIPGEPAAALLYLVANLLLLPGILPVTPVVTVAWSLSYVALSYLAIGALYRATGMRAWGSGQRAGLWLGIAAAVTLAAEVGGFAHGRLAYFAMGGLLADVLPGRRNISGWAPLGGAVVGLALLARGPAGAGALLGLTLFAAAWITAEPLQPVLRRLPLESLARVSYPVFLTHGPVLHLVRWLQPETGGMGDLAALLLAALAVILAVAKLADALALRPLRQRLEAAIEARRIPSEALAARAAFQ
jgi:peptidoglycan/LPS O-acetylase OafA/YrhL